MEHCQQWQAKLTGLLNSNALRDLNALLEYFDTNSNILTTPPKNLDELKDRLHLLDKCQKDEKEMETRIQPIEDQYAKLAEFEVIPPDEETSKKNSMRPQLDEFRNTLL